MALFPLWRIFIFNLINSFSFLFCVGYNFEGSSCLEFCGMTAIKTLGGDTLILIV